MLGQFSATLGKPPNVSRFYSTAKTWSRRPARASDLLSETVAVGRWGAGRFWSKRHGSRWSNETSEQSITEFFDALAGRCG